MNKRVIAIAVPAVLVAVLLMGFLASRRERATEAENEAPVATGERVTTVDGLPAVVLPMAEQQASGIRVSAIPVVRRRPTSNAVASVLAATELTSLRAGIAAAQAEAKAAQAKAAASGAQLQRLRLLRDQEQDVSLTELQAAEATLVADRAAAQAAQAALTANKQAAALAWGPTLAHEVAGDSTQFERLASGRDVLLQVTLPADTTVATAPRQVEVQAGGDTIMARYLAVASRTDARLQGPSWYYVAPGGQLRPGTTTNIALPAGEAQEGRRVPESAIVRWQGRAWTYTRHDATHFVRRQLPDGAATPDGWFVDSRFGNGEPVVIAGTQLLFSEELRSQLQGDEE